MEQEELLKCCWNWHRGNLKHRSWAASLREELYKTRLGCVNTGNQRKEIFKHILGEMKKENFIQLVIKRMREMQQRGLQYEN